jgi:hypothetical protein
MRTLAYGGGVTAPDRLTRDGVEVFLDMAAVPALLALT